MSCLYLSDRAGVRMNDVHEDEHTLLAHSNVPRSGHTRA